MCMNNILLVDDDEMVRYSLKRYLSKEGYNVTEAENGVSALKQIEEAQFDLIITDIIMPEMEGLELITALRESYPLMPIIAMSGGGRMNKAEYLSIANMMGVMATLSKPFAPEELVGAVRKLLSSE